LKPVLLRTFFRNFIQIKKMTKKVRTTKKTLKKRSKKTISEKPKVKSEKLASKSNKMKEKRILLPTVLDFTSDEVKDEDNTIENVNAKDLLCESMDKIPCLIEPIFHKVGLAALIGSSDSGKSAILRQLCVSVVTGKDFLGWKVTPEYFCAYYVSTEDDKTAIASLLKKQNKVWNMNADALENLTFVFDTEDLIIRLEKMLIEKPADLIVIDAFSDIFSGQLYETNKVRECLNEYNRLAQKYGCLIVFLHHTNKRSDDLAPSKHNALGSQGFEAKMRLMIELKNNKIIPKNKFFCIVKGNYLSSSYKTKAYNILFDDNLTFSMLDTKTSFELINKEKKDIDQLEEDYNDIMLHRKDGMTWDQVSNVMSIPRATIFRKIKKWETYLDDLKNTETN
jgi:hypothetical protein